MIVTGEFPVPPAWQAGISVRQHAGCGGKRKTVLYGDYSGLSVNFRENISIQVLREKYATQHAIGVVSWFEFDSRVTNNQKLAALVQNLPNGGGGRIGRPSPFVGVTF